MTRWTKRRKSCVCPVPRAHVALTHVIHGSLFDPPSLSICIKSDTLAFLVYFCSASSCLTHPLYYVMHISLDSVQCLHLFHCLFPSRNWRYATSNLTEVVMAVMEKFVTKKWSLETWNVLEKSWHLFYWLPNHSRMHHLKNFPQKISEGNALASSNVCTLWLTSPNLTRLIIIACKIVNSLMLMSLNSYCMHTDFFAYCLINSCYSCYSCYDFLWSEL